MTVREAAASNQEGDLKVHEKTGMHAGGACRNVTNSDLCIRRWQGEWWQVHANRVKKEGRGGSVTSDTV